VRPKHQYAMASLLLAAMICVSCSSGKTASTSATPPPPASTALGVGVTPTTVKVGIALVDFNCISQFVSSIRVNQEVPYNAYINDINMHGGVAGRRIIPVYESFCPIGNSQSLALCTKFTEDDKVFAVLGDFVDFSGDSQTCLARDHNTVLMTFELTQAIMNQSPPGMIVLPGTNPEREDSVLFELLRKEHTLAGKKVGVLGDSTGQDVITSSVEPGLKQLGVQTGSTAILNITGADTSAAQDQLASFIEKWKSEHVNALFISGDEAASQQFAETLQAQMPGVLLITDAVATDVLGYAQQEARAGRHPNPYAGIITAGGQTSQEYDESANWKYCATIYKEQTGQVAPNAEAVVPGPNGKTLDTYGGINDSCQLMTMFHDIAQRVGPDLNNQNWVRTVDNYGSIRNVGSGPYASLHAGKYDVDDTFRLEQFDPSILPDGQWQPITPLEDITG
jgi:hypothetical protein